jgi:uncharacterized protein YraI
MKTLSRIRQLFLITILLTIAGLTSSCERGSSSGPRAWFDSPRGGARVPVGTPITISSHAYAREGLGEIILYVNGEAYQRNAPAEAGADFSDFRQEWLPTEPGTYSLQIRAYDINGDTGNPATISVTVIGEVVAEVAEAAEPATDTPTPVYTDTPTPVISDTPTPTPVITETYTPTPVEEVEVATCPPLATVQTAANCRSGPGTAYDILASLGEGSSSTVVGRNADSSWWVVDPSGSSTCWVWSDRVTLNNYACEVPIHEAPPLPPTDTPTLPPPTPTFTPTSPPPADTTPPPAPAPQNPANGATQSCSASVTLSWSAVSDESGIATYYIKLEKQISAGNWQSAGGFTSSTTQVDVPVDCGIIYRWTVRAEDNAGNFSDWSTFSQFGVNLS